MYSRRDNLVFEGIQKQLDQQTEFVLKKFFISALGFNQEECEGLLLSICHRFGKPKSNQSRAIIARFVLDKERNKVWQRRSMLKGSTYVMCEDFPVEITNRRKLMYPLY